ncbi:unnamed protein product [Linum trigynum]|uniref:Uncharacterized protein n=1 Tax=Linum trigynum TaxID=586398 RepID=A0AAV2CGL4_9ROSI
MPTASSPSLKKELSPPNHKTPCSLPPIPAPLSFCQKLILFILIDCVFHESLMVKNALTQFDNSNSQGLGLKVEVGCNSREEIGNLGGGGFFVDGEGGSYERRPLLQLLMR